MADSGVRSSWDASAANRRSRASLAARRRSAVCTWPSIRLKARPTWPVSVAGSVSGTPAGSSTSSESSGSSATCDAVAATRRSGRSENLTQRVPPAPASSSTAREDGGLGQRDPAERVVQGGQRQAGDVDGTVAAGFADRGEQERAAGVGQVAGAGRDVLLAAGGGSQPGRLPRRDAAQRLLVGRRQLVGGVADDGGDPRLGPEDGDVRSLGQALAHLQVAGAWEAGSRSWAGCRSGSGRSSPPGPPPAPGRPVMPGSLPGLGL